MNILVNIQDRCILYPDRNTCKGYCMVVRLARYYIMKAYFVQTSGISNILCISYIAVILYCKINASVLI